MGLKDELETYVRNVFTEEWVRRQDRRFPTPMTLR